MKAKNIKVGSGVPNKSYFRKSEEVNELINIASSSLSWEIGIEMKTS